MKDLPKGGNFLTAEIKREYLNKKDKPAERPWFLEEDEDQLHMSVFQLVGQVQVQDSQMRHQFYQYRMMYGNPEAFHTPENPNTVFQSTQSMDLLQVNVIQSIIDTAASMIAKNQPKPEFFTMGEDNYKIKQAAQTLNSFVDGVFDTCGNNGDNIYQVMKKVFLDAAITGTGAILTYEFDDEIRCECVPIDEIVVDAIEGIQAAPSQIHRVKYVTKDVLHYQYPEFHSQIEEASVSGAPTAVLQQTKPNLVEVVESWHLKSGKKAKDGRHAICIATATLLSEPYHEKFFPITFFRWANRPIGYGSFWGRGIAEELSGIQDRINALLQVIQLCQELVAVPIAFVPTGANVNSDHLLANDIFRMVEYDGPQPPLVNPLSAVSPELYTHLDWLIQQAYQISGVSAANASGTKPPEVKSGTAIEMVADIASGRFELVGQDWERLFIQVAKVVLSQARQIYKRTKKLTVKIVDSKHKMLKKVDFQTIADIDDEYLGMRCFPVSGLPSSPAGRMDQIMQYVQAGWIDQTQAMDLINFPDLQDYTNMQTAPLELIRKNISLIIDEGEYHPPTPFLNLQLALQLGTLELQRAQQNNVEEERVGLLMDWLNDINEQLNQQSPPAPQPSAPPNQQQTPTAQPPANVSPPPQQ